MAAKVGCCLALVLIACAARGQPAGPPRTTGDPNAASRIVLGIPNEELAAGAEAIGLGDYKEGIRLTKLGLDKPASARDRSGALSNLCAAYAAIKEADQAITTCTESLSVNASNWRAYSNRAYAYFLKELYAEAAADIEAAAAINPNARALATLRAMINERTLQPRVIVQ